MEDQYQNLYYATFGQMSPLRDGYVKISASSRGEAHEEMTKVFAAKWSHLYSHQEFMGEGGAVRHFPAGQYGHEMQGL